MVAERGSRKRGPRSARATLYRELRGVLRRAQSSLTADQYRRLVQDPEVVPLLERLQAGESVSEEDCHTLKVEIGKVVESLENGGQNGADCRDDGESRVEAQEIGRKPSELRGAAGVDGVRQKTERTRDNLGGRHQTLGKTTFLRRRSGEVARLEFGVQSLHGCRGRAVRRRIQDDRDSRRAGLERQDRRTMDGSELTDVFHPCDAGAGQRTGQGAQRRFDARLRGLETADADIRASASNEVRGVTAKDSFISPWRRHCSRAQLFRKTCEGVRNPIGKDRRLGFKKSA